MNHTTVRRVIAGASGSPAGLQALRQAADLARHHDAVLVPVLAWVPPDSARLPWPELRAIWKDDAWQRLWQALDTALGGLPAGITTQPVALRGKPGTAKAMGEKGMAWVNQEWRWEIIARRFAEILAGE